MTRAIWLDCDPGHDDAMAIILAAKSPQIKLLGISTVSGNQTVDKTFQNALVLSKIVGFTGPVLRGQDRPILKAAKHDPGIHGESGLDGSPLLDEFSSRALETSQIEDSSSRLSKTVIETYKTMYATIRESDTPVTIVATGALTNIAVLIRLFPDIFTYVNQIVLMGGAMGIGNRHPVAEFNIECDPEAASIVFNSPCKVVMVPLEVTHTAIATPEILNRILKIGTPFARMVVQLLTFFQETYKTVFNFTRGPPVHDPCAVAYVIAPELFDAPKMRVDVVCGDHICAGQTVCDIWGYSSKQPNVHVAKKMNVPFFWEKMIQAIQMCNRSTDFNSFDFQKDKARL